MIAVLDAWRAAIVEPDRPRASRRSSPGTGGGAPVRPVERAAESLPRDRSWRSTAPCTRPWVPISTRSASCSTSPPAIAARGPGGVHHVRGAAARSPDGTWWRGRPTVLATYVDGGLDELAELVHETGHAIHLAAIHTRPAFTEWPASDALTEALADLVAHDVAEPAWQRRWIPATRGRASRQPGRRLARRRDGAPGLHPHPARADGARRRLDAVRDPPARRTGPAGQRHLD